MRVGSVGAKYWFRGSGRLGALRTRLRFEAEERREREEEPKFEVEGRRGLGVEVEGRRDVEG